MPSRDARQLVRQISGELRDNAREGGDRYDRIRTAVGRAFLDGPGSNREEYEERLGQVLSRMRRGLDEQLLESLFRNRPNAAVLCASDFETTIIHCDALIAAASRSRAALPFTAPDDGSALKTALREADVNRRQANEIANKLGEAMLGVPRILTRDRRGQGLLRLLESCPGGLSSREAQVRAWHVGPTEGMARCIATVLARRSTAQAARERAQAFFAMSVQAAQAFVAWGAPSAGGGGNASAPAPQPRRAAPSATDLLSQARAHFRARRYRESAMAYQRVTRMDPTNSGAFAGLGSALLHGRQTRPAVQAYRQAVQLQPGNPNYHAFLGEALAASGDQNGAVAEYQAALAIQPNNFIASQGLSRLGTRANRGQAQQNRSLSPAQQADRWRTQGRDHFRARRFPQAAAAYEQAVRLQPDHAGSHSGLGAARLQMGDTAGAVSAYQNAVRLNPNHSGYWSALARAQARSGDRQGAIASLQRAIQIDPDNRNAQEGLSALGAAPARGSAVAAAAPTSAGEPTHVGNQLPETPSRDQILNVMRPLQSAVAACVPGFTGRLTFSFAVIGESGVVEAVTVAEEDQLEIEEVECMQNVIGASSFPRFTRERLEISYPYMLR
jgi:tetratricopeptide (TPR) repeat protein